MSSAAGAKSPQVAIRVPPDLKQWLKEEAVRNQSSQNSEIIRALRERMDRVANRGGLADAG